ncbi:MAG: carbohydrate-binding domain-containing protein [Lachnospiraceae bacterium]|nr:carbohydrate-binding domain-containing protein [Lachnospiraceae bacterium]
MRNFIKSGFLMLCTAALLTGCQTKDAGLTANESSSPQTTDAVSAEVKYDTAVNIELSDAETKVNGEMIANAATDSETGVYAANDIIFYLAGQGITYGEGSEADEHSQEEADANTVIHITKPGKYIVSGKLSAGQIAVDLGEDAETDPEAVVTLILNGADITCKVAPAVIFYNVYECGNDDTESATKDVDTSSAGANVILTDGSISNVNGSYVAKIFESCELNEAGTEVINSKKLHKYDAAFYSKQSMNICGESENSGILNITAENEGLDSELHLTLRGGNINITSGNDGINTNEDNVSVTTVDGANVNILVTGETGEGDGIDSNGWLVINSGSVIAQACSTSGDAGIDSDMGIHINGGLIMASGNMLDAISESSQTYAVFQFATADTGKKSILLKNASGDSLFQYTPENNYSYLILSSPELAEGNYTLWQNDAQLSAMPENFGGGHGGIPGGPKPEGMEPPQNGEKPKDMKKPQDGRLPEDMEIPPDDENPDGMKKPEKGIRSDFGEASTDIHIVSGGNQFVIM